MVGRVPASGTGGGPSGKLGGCEDEPLSCDGPPKGLLWVCDPPPNANNPNAGKAPKYPNGKPDDLLNRPGITLEKPAPGSCCAESISVGALTGVMRAT